MVVLENASSRRGELAPLQSLLGDEATAPRIAGRRGALSHRSTHTSPAQASEGRPCREHGQTQPSRGTGAVGLGQPAEIEEGRAKQRCAEVAFSRNVDDGRIELVPEPSLAFALEELEAGSEGREGLLRKL